jgi:hypothetical protein
MEMTLSEIWEKIGHHVLFWLAVVVVLSIAWLSGPSHLVGKKTPPRGACCKRCGARISPCWRLPSGIARARQRSWRMTGRRNSRF